MSERPTTPIPGLTSEMRAQIPLHPQAGKAPLGQNTMESLVWAVVVVATTTMILVPLGILGWPSLILATVLFVAAGLLTKWRNHWHYEMDQAMTLEVLAWPNRASEDPLRAIRAAGYNRAGTLRQVLHAKPAPIQVGDLAPVAHRIWP